MRLVRNCIDAMKTAAAAAAAAAAGGNDGAKGNGSSMPTDPALYIRKVIEGWFLDVPLIEIHYENFAQWTCWAFFGKVSAQCVDALLLVSSPRPALTSSLSRCCIRTCRR